MSGAPRNTRFTPRVRYELALVELFDLLYPGVRDQSCTHTEHFAWRIVSEALGRPMVQERIRLAGPPPTGTGGPF